MNDQHPFEVEKEGFVAWLVLNRPDRRNSMNLRFFEALQEHFEAFDRDPEVRVGGAPPLRTPMFKVLRPTPIGLPTPTPKK